MKSGRRAAFLTVAVTTLYCSAPADEGQKRMRVLTPDQLSLSERLHGRTGWQMKNGETLRVETVDGVTRLRSPHEGIIDVREPERVDQAVSSQSGSCLLLRVENKSTGRYSRLIHVLHKRNVGWVAQTSMAQTATSITELHYWIQEIGAVSNTGRMALLRVAEPSPEGNGYRVNYNWQTWDLNASKKISDGILVPDEFNDTGQSFGRLNTWLWIIGAGAACYGSYKVGKSSNRRRNSSFHTL